MKGRSFLWFGEAIVLLDGERSFFITEYSEERSVGVIVWGSDASPSTGLEGLSSEGRSKNINDRSDQIYRSRKNSIELIHFYGGLADQ